MTRVLRIIVAVGFLWWIAAAFVGSAPTIETDETGGAAIGLTVALIGIMLFWLLVDKVLRMLSSIFSRDSHERA